MASVSSNRQFLSNGLDINMDYILDRAVEWIASNMDPEDVFSKEQLKMWAENNGFTEEK